MSAPESDYYEGLHRPDPIPTLHNDERSSLDIVMGGERARRWENVPLEAVITETPVIDPEHASELAADIKRDQQLMPVLLRASLNDEGNVMYEIADGFHRSAGMKAAGMESIEAIVMYGWTYEELLTKRILSANSVKSVKFGRLAIWMDELYQLTPWHEMGIGLSDAVTATVFNTEEVGGKNIGRENTAKLREWVQGQSRNWQMTPGDLWSSLSVIEQSDPDLVHLVRPKVEKGEEHSFIVEGHLKAASEAFPGKQNYPVQRALINWVLTRKATPKDVDRMAARLNGLIELDMKARQIFSVIEGIESDMAREKAEAAEEENRRRDAAGLREGRYENQMHRASSGQPRSNESRQRPLTQKDRLALQEKELQQLKWWEKTEGLDDNQRRMIELILGQERKIQDIEEEFQVDKAQIGNMLVDALERRDSMA